MRNMMGLLGSTLVVGAALFFLGLSLSGLMQMEPAGGLLRTFGGLVAFLVVALGTIVAAARSS